MAAEYKSTLFHGSNVVVKHPAILIHGYYKDFGYGFYCTCIEKQAKRWALTKRDKHFVNQYSYQPPENLKVCSFSEMSEEWLDFVASCRSGNEHFFDVVEGPMADDQIWDYVESFLEGDISREAFWELVKFKYPTHQIAFCTQKALACLTFERSYEI